MSKKQNRKSFFVSLYAMKQLQSFSQINVWKKQEQASEFALGAKDEELTNGQYYVSSYFDTSLFVWPNNKIAKPSMPPNKLTNG